MFRTRGETVYAVLDLLYRERRPFFVRFDRHLGGFDGYDLSWLLLRCRPALLPGFILYLDGVAKLDELILVRSQGLSELLLVYLALYPEFIHLDELPLGLLEPLLMFSVGWSQIHTSVLERTPIIVGV